MYTVVVIYQSELLSLDSMGSVRFIQCLIFQTDFTLAPSNLNEYEEQLFTIIVNDAL